MSDSKTLRPTVNRVVRELVKPFGIYKPKLEVSFASKNGDSYSGEVYRIILRPDEQELEDHANNNVDMINIPHEIRLIAKIPPRSEKRRLKYNSARAFAREHYIYEYLFPVFEKFQRLHLKEQYIFKHYPRCIAASSVYEDEYVLLNDLSLQGFKNSDRPTALHFEKCVAVLKTIAKFHAISFAMKDQQPERLAKLTSKLSEITFTKPINEELDIFLKRNVGYSMTTLDPEKDKVIIKKLMKFRENYASFMAECCAEKEDAIVLHGDCWISNIMFRRNHSTSDKYDITFLDWQGVRCGTVAIDLSYFIFCCTDAEVRKRLPDLMRIYHDQLIQRIDEFGSNGQALFPYEKLEWHMKKYAKFGLGMALISLHATCCKSSDLVDVQIGLDEMDSNNVDKYTLPLLANPAYKKRMADVLRDFQRLDYF
ncbi:uncharacterized oxidoreductase dhs-27-like isoform X2 [Contarinia nasturtii]|uniref:uncharacterized oxidoreductase dhs-27-like isoform X2 n=1 Tax=Contarinia nasturtii TaxID=265458 RepID=UPI0012D3E872|nr:uncharacterized oxidoreductase dhs-27-like isoform X2 [Contarinia nasturtii]